MLSTKDIKATGSGKISKTIKPGNITAKILDISLQPLKSDPNAVYLIFHLEGEDQGPEFEGFMYDKENPNKGRAKGQVGKVRYSAYPYRDGVTKAGKPKNRDMDILRSLVEFATVAGKRDQLNDIQADTIENFVKIAAKLLANDNFYYWCIGGSAYLKDDGNKDFSLYLPRYDKNFKNYEEIGTVPSKVAVFNYATHVEDKTAEQSGAPQQESKGWGDSAPTQEGTWKPTSFNI